MKIKQLAYQVIKKFGIDYSDSIKYIDWKEEQIYLILWCNRYLMYSTYKENFNTLHGMSELNEVELINKLYACREYK